MMIKHTETMEMNAQQSIAMAPASLCSTRALQMEYNKYRSSSSVSVRFYYNPDF